MADEHSKPHWSYDGATGPAHWGELDPAYAACSTGKTQSPIDINGATPSGLPKLKFDYRTAPLNIIDNGHTIQVNYAPGSTLTVDGKAYTLKQFHFHHPSEERLNGREYPLVAHLVHADAEGHLAVVAVLFKKGAGNALLNTLWKNIPEEKEKATDVAGSKVNVKSLLPSKLDYYTFVGSLTTPPCSEGVKWIVLRTAKTLSAAELAAFVKRYPMNARPVQSANGREIKATK